VRSTEGLLLHCLGKLTFALFLLSTIYSHNLFRVALTRKLLRQIFNFPVVSVKIEKRIAVVNNGVFDFADVDCVVAAFV
jgi:hypothetical protein